MSNKSPEYYYRRTEEYLTNYNQLKASIQNKKEEIEEIKEIIMLSCEKTYIRIEDINEARLILPVEDNFIYKDGIIGGVIEGMKYPIKVMSSPVSDNDPTFNMAEAIITHPRIRELESDIKWTTNLIRRIDRSFATLVDDEKVIVKLRFLDTQAWENIAHKVHQSVSTVKRKKRRAVKTITMGIFGRRIMRG